MLFAGLFWSSCLVLLGGSLWKVHQEKTSWHSMPPNPGFTCNQCHGNCLGLDCGVTGKVLSALSLRSHMWAAVQGSADSWGISYWAHQQVEAEVGYVQKTGQALLDCSAVKSCNPFAFHLHAFKPDKLFLCLLLSHCQLLQVSYNWKYEALKPLRFYSCGMLVVQYFFFLT